MNNGLNHLVTHKSSELTGLLFGTATVGRHRAHDSDGDGMPDYFERLHGLNVHRDDSALDRDDDGLTNYQEYTSGTSPVRSNSDSNADGQAEGEDHPGQTPVERVRPENWPVFDYMLSL